MKQVLVIDDNAVNRKLASVMLRKRGWNVDEAEDGFIGLDKLHAKAYDHVLLDISMPGIDGEEVCRRIRQDPALQHLHVVAYTAHAFESDHARLREIGFNDIITKPVSMAILQEKLPDRKSVV